MTDIVLSIADFGTQHSVDNMLDALSKEIKTLKGGGNNVNVTVVLNGDTYYPGFSLHPNNLLQQTDQFQAYYKDIFITLLGADTDLIIMNLGNHELGVTGEGFNNKMYGLFPCCKNMGRYRRIKSAENYSRVRDKVIDQLNKEIGNLPVEYQGKVKLGARAFTAGEREAFAFDSTDCYGILQYNKLLNYICRCQNKNETPLVFSHHPAVTKSSSNPRPSSFVESVYKKAGRYSGDLWARFETEKDYWSDKVMSHNMHVARVLSRAMVEAKPESAGHDERKSSFENDTLGLDLICGHVHARCEERYHFFLYNNVRVKINQYTDGTGGTKGSLCCGEYFGYVCVKCSSNDNVIAFENTGIKVNKPETIGIYDVRPNKVPVISWQQPKRFKLPLAIVLLGLSASALNYLYGQEVEGDYRNAITASIAGFSVLIPLMIFWYQQGSQSEVGDRSVNFKKPVNDAEERFICHDLFV